MSTPASRSAPTAPQQAGTVLRPLGAFERGYDLWSREHPMQFCVVAELSADPGVDRLTGALAAVQRRHPLLAATIRDTGDLATSAPELVHVDAPLPLRRAAEGQGWPDVVAAELVDPVERVGPLVRAVLVAATPGAGTALVLTAEHAVADGLSMVGVLRDTVAALEGESLGARPVPPSQEDLLAALPAGDPAPTGSRTEPDAGPEPADERLTAPAGLRPFDGAAPQVDTLAWSVEETAALVERCHAERASVTGPWWPPRPTWSRPSTAPSCGSTSPAA